MRVILSRYPIFLIKETDELDDNYDRKVKVTNVDSGEKFGPASPSEARDWCWSYEIVENLGIFESEKAADEAGDNYNREVRAKYMQEGYTRSSCSMNFGIVNNILEEREQRGKLPTPEEVEAKLKELLGGDVNIRTVEDEDECEIHNFMKKDDDDEPTLN